MTKKERAEFDAAIEKARIIGALRWTERVDEDIPAPNWGEKTSGWKVNPSATYEQVRQCWSDCVSHGNGTERHPGSSATRGAAPLHSNKLRALKALRHELEIAAAGKLAMIDRMIEDEQRNSTT